MNYVIKSHYIMLKFLNDYTYIFNLHVCFFLWNSTISQKCEPLQCAYFLKKYHYGHHLQTKGKVYKIENEENAFVKIYLYLYIFYSFCATSLLLFFRIH